MSNASWKAHFTQPISGYDPIEAQGLSELGYALLHRQIPEQEYLQWARENFELASIDMKFFQTQSAPKAIFEKVKDAYALHKVVYGLFEDVRTEADKAAGKSSGILYADKGGDFHTRQILLLWEYRGWS